MLRTGWTTLAILFVIAGTVGVLVARHDMDREVQGVEYEFLQSAYTGIRFISPVDNSGSSDEGWTSYPVLSAARKQAPSSKLISIKFGIAPFALGLYSSMLMIVGLVLLAFPPAWSFWKWILRPMSMASSRISYTARITVALAALASTSLIVCSFFDPSGLIAVAIAPVDHDWRRVAWETGWTSPFIQSVRSVGACLKLALFGLVTMYSTLLVVLPSQPPQTSKS